jgi:4-hydroxy-4-methyl-2-oxoglutarate aldolase
VVVTDVPRPPLERVDAIAPFGVATVHEALGRVGLLGPSLRPIQQGARIAGTAVTALCWPGDNLMVHAAVEQCGEGDVLVVTTTSPSSDGLFGELFATALRRRGVRGLIITTGVRDTAELRAMGFPVWSAFVSAQGTVKATAGSVNVPVAIGAQTVRPGDVIVADDDGVLCVPAERLEEGIERSAAREAKEERSRAAFAGGELSLDHYGLRQTLERLGVRYVRHDEADDA